jgi:4'-phosphopantetheinyl transferase
MTGRPEVFRWLLNVEERWPALDASGKVTTSTKEWGSSKDVEPTLDRLPPEEKAKVLRFHFIRDAKLCLGSFLLKHHAIALVCNLSWAETVISEDENRKPCYKATDPNGQTLEFNVSHHGTLVAMVGCTGHKTKMGVDVVQMNFEKDFAAVKLDKGGFSGWVKTYELVFSDREIAEISGYTTPAASDFRVEIKAKLCHFYAHWCLKEAYVKMTGEALLASWLKDLEFRNVQVPLPSSQLQSKENPGDWGQISTDTEIWFRGSRVTDVKMELQAYGEDYMIATAISDPSVPLPCFQPSIIKI